MAAEHDRAAFREIGLDLGPAARQIALVGMEADQQSAIAGQVRPFEIIEVDDIEP
ncbi:hypothetical protein D3C72_2165540 [compost metagenome]